MAKFNEVDDDIQGEFDSVYLQTSLSQVGLNIKVLGNEKQKEVTKVVKATDLVKHLSGEDIIVIVNQGIFEQLQPEQKVIVIEEALASIIYNNEKDTITIKKGDVQTFSLVLRKFGYEAYEVLTETIKTLYALQAGEDSTPEDITA